MSPSRAEATRPAAAAPWNAVVVIAARGPQAFQPAYGERAVDGSFPILEAARIGTAGKAEDR